MAPLGTILVGAGAAALAYVARLIGPKVRVGDTKLVSVDAAGFGMQLSPVLGPAPFFLFEVSQVSPEGAYGRIVGAGAPTGAGTDLVRVTRTKPWPEAPQQMGPITVFAPNRWQG